jgi:hypothetical protein
MREAAETAPVVVHGGRVELRVPLGPRNGAPICWMRLAYRTGDPLVVEITLRSPSGAVAVERTILRRDLLDALQIGHRCLDLSIAPAREPVTLIFREARTSVPVEVRRAQMIAFLQETERLVPADDESEAAALGAAFASMVERDAASR